jgi:hypothetical protein
VQDQSWRLSAAYRTQRLAFWRTLTVCMAEYDILHHREVEFLDRITADDLEGSMDAVECFLKGKSAEIEMDLLHFTTFIYNSVVGRCLFVTEHGRFGLGPITAEHGDNICVLFWAEVLFVLRRDLAIAAYKMLGDAPIDDLMRGEVFGNDSGAPPWQYPAV